MTLFRLSSKVRNLLYHAKIANWQLIRDYASRLPESTRPGLGRLIVYSWQYGASSLDYFKLKFYEKTEEQRRSYLTSSLRHELTRQVNDDRSTYLLKDKQAFLQHFKDFLGRAAWSWEEVLKAADTLGPPPRLVIKPRFGQAGIGIHFLSLKRWDELFNFIREHKINPVNHIYEEYLSQHPALARLSPKSVNTLRVVTFFDGAEVSIWGIYLRMGRDSDTDNVCGGGLCVNVNADGLATGAAMSNNPFESLYELHPISGERIVGFKVPHFAQAIAFVKTAARLLPEVKSVGWDVAILPNGPCLIEGNDNWSNFVQVPGGQGLRPLAAAVCPMDLVYK